MAVLDQEWRQEPWAQAASSDTAALGSLGVLRVRRVGSFFFWFYCVCLAFFVCFLKVLPWFLMVFIVVLEV